MKKILIACALLLFPAVGHTYEFKPMFTAQHLDVMAPIYKELTGRRPLSIKRLRAMTIDLNGDGESEVLIRDENKCEEAFYCSVSIGRFDQEDQKWRLIGEGYGYDVELKEVDVGFSGITLWSYSRSERIHLKYVDGLYERDLSSYGDIVDFTDAKIAFEGKEGYLQRVLARGLGSKYPMIEQATSDDDRALIAASDLNYDGQVEYLVYVDYLAVCDNSGCPLLIYSDLGKRPFSVLYLENHNMAVSNDVEEGRLKSLISESGTFAWGDGRYEFKEIGQ